MTLRVAGLCRDAITALLVFGAALALAASLRYRLIEPAALAHACAADPGADLCWLRAWLVRGFQHQEPGWIAAITGLIGWFLAPRGGACDKLEHPARLPLGGSAGTAAGSMDGRLAHVSSLVALAFGAIGLMLYSFDPAAVGLVLGVIALTRASIARHGTR